MLPEVAGEDEPEGGEDGGGGESGGGPDGGERGFTGRAKDAAVDEGREVRTRGATTPTDTPPEGDGVEDGGKWRRTHSRGPSTRTRAEACNRSG